MSIIGRELRKVTTVTTLPNGRLLAHCPLHQERTPSLLADENTNKWHCLGCGAGGDASALIRLLATRGEEAAT
jgi:DNA primase